ncbi:MAG: hypothetical protein R3252_05395 [Robiginitalea sp.]|nr:hypothetical protein [Robiginitalea sp.]
MVSTKKYVLVLISALFVMGCSDDDDAGCSLVLCAANEIIRLEFLADGSNPLADGTYASGEVSVDGKTMEPLEVAIRTDVAGTTSALLEIFSPDWEAGAYSYTVGLGEDWSVPIEVRFTKSKSTDPCCGERLEILSLDSSSYPVEGQIGYYTVVLR